MNKRWIDLFLIFLGITLVVVLLPFVFFAVQRITGIVVGFEEWSTLGQEQGPWRGRLSGFTIFLPVMVWSPIIVVIAIFFALRDVSWKPLLGVLGLLGLQAAAMIIQLETLAWLID
ncbi:MAG: hypothetical protein HKN28_06120 [Alphaproteobacteria bacterium]|nr:hypothetical protein [Alphaproteobacteria bacterium]